MFSQTFNYIYKHPLNKGHLASALGRYVAWQVGSRLVPGAVVVPFINQSTLLVRPGMSGATQNIYCGLHEFEDTAFLLHLLRPTDLFVDVGANVGVYTILASGAIGATSLCFEPNPSSFAWLKKNLRLNNIEGRVEASNACAGKAEGLIDFDDSGPETNTGCHVADPASRSNATPTTPVVTVDGCVAQRHPTLMKIDVEGFESAVLSGAQSVLHDPALLALIVESNDDCIRYGFGVDDAHNAIMAHGFQPAVYEPFARDLQPIEGRNQASANTLYIRNMQAVRDRILNAPKFHVCGREI